MNKNVNIENDANCFTLSESIDGNGKHYKIVFGIILGSGVASKLNVDIDDEIEVYTQFKHSSYKKMIQFKQKYRVAGIFDIGIYEYNNAYAFLNLSEFLAILQQNNKRDIFADRVRIKLSDPLNSRSFTSEFNRNNNEFFAQDWSYTHKSLFTCLLYTSDAADE